MRVVARSFRPACSALCLAATVLPVGACGTAARPDYAPPQVIRVGIHESGGGFRLDVYELRLTAGGWWVQARVANATSVTWNVGRPHRSGGTKFGLFVAASKDDLLPERLQATARTVPTFLAAKFDPPLPSFFGPHTSWRGRFGGDGRIPRGRYVSFAFGRFTTLETPPAGLPSGLLEVTARSVHVP